jgi:hypothetical protein
MAIETSPVDAVIDTEKEVDEVELKCFFILAVPVYPLRFEADPSLSVEVKVSVKSDPWGITMLITGFAAMILF